MKIYLKFEKIIVVTVMYYKQSVFNMTKLTFFQQNVDVSETGIASPNNIIE